MRLSRRYERVLRVPLVQLVGRMACADAVLVPVLVVSVPGREWELERSNLCLLHDIQTHRQ